MKLRSIKLNNFAPYYGDHILEFGTNQPIVLVHGENMRGKTSLLNAIRWALYGHAFDRTGRQIPIRNLLNWDANAEGNSTMSVEVTFDVEGVVYVLTRSIQPRNVASQVVHPADRDFEVKLFLRKDGAYFNSMEEAQTELNRILPERVSRFFLFDGELLNEYESLLADPTGQAPLVKESIEDILGVPALEHAIADLRENLREAARRQSTLARRDRDAAQYAGIASRLDQEVQQLEADSSQMKDQKVDLEHRVKELDDRLRASAAVEVQVARFQEIQDQIKRLREERASLEDQRRQHLVEGWKDLLQIPINEKQEVLQAKLDEEINARERLQQLNYGIYQLKLLEEQGICPLCGQSAGDECVATAQSRRGELQRELDDVDFDENSLTETNAAIRSLRRIRPANVMEAVNVIEDRMMKIRVDLSDLEFERDEINDQLKEHDQAEISRNRREYVELVKELGLLEQALAAKQDEITTKEAEAARNRALIKQVGGPELDRLNREVEIYQDCIALFQRALEQMRDDLRKAVEKDASEIFLQLTTDPTYTGLRINEYYGLAILDASGGQVEVRSAGAEQVVALSLIGALNRNAVRRGPIVMDTPFGRLDPRHRENILKFIPTMAEQITLLVHGGEVDRDRDLSNIQDKIEREYEIEYVSSSKSNLAKIGA